MRKTKLPRIEMLGLDWLNLYGRWSKIKGNDLLNLLKDKIAINDKERAESGFGGGWHYIKYPDMGLRVATKDDGDATINFQGLWFQGGCPSAYEELQRIIRAVKTIPDIEWSITRVDVARTMFGATLEEAFPHHKSKKYIWDFSIGNADDHNTKKRKTDWKYTGFKLIQGRWRLGVYDKAWDLVHGPYTNHIKQAYFNALRVDDESISRVELRVESVESLVHIQGILNNPCSEEELCKTVLKRWGTFHRIKTVHGNDEARFHRMFMDFEGQTFEKVPRRKIEKIKDENIGIKLADHARSYIRYGYAHKMPVEVIERVFKEQMEWLMETGEISSQKPAMPPELEAEGDSVEE